MKRFYYLKAHLGSIRATVQGGSPVANDDFSDTLAQWTTVMGTGFSIQNGELVNTSAGPDNILINSSAGVMADGTLTVDVKTFSGDGDPGIVFRYQDNDNFYLIDPWAAPNVVTIYKHIPEGYQRCSSVHVPTIVMGTSYRVQVVMTGANIQVYWNGSPVVGFTDGNPLLLGKVGFRQCLYRICKWDNMIVSTAGTGDIASSDDYDAWGMQLEGRSTNTGQTNEKYRFAGTERDAESGSDWMQARTYDARIGRFLTCDPLAGLGGLERWSPYSMAFDNTVRFSDPTGWYPTDGDDQKKTPEPEPSKVYELPPVVVEAKRTPAHDLTILSYDDGTRHYDVDVAELAAFYSAGKFLYTGAKEVTSRALTRVGTFFAKKATSEIATISVRELIRTQGRTLSKKAFSELLENIRKEGIKEPLKYVVFKGEKFVVDGHHRLEAAIRLGLESIPAQEVQLPYQGYKTVADLFEGLTQ